MPVNMVCHTIHSLMYDLAQYTAHNESKNCWFNKQLGYCSCI